MSNEAKTLCEAFQRTATIDPDAVALRTLGGERELTWREYAARVRAIAGGLSALGIERGDTVALLLTNRPEFNLVDTAAIHLGAVPFSIYNTLSAEQITYLLENSGCTVVVTEGQYVEKVRQAGGSVEHVVVVDAPDSDPHSLATLEATTADDFDFESTWQSVTGDDLLTLIYTSGTTGNPKGVELTHDNLIAQVRGLDQVTKVEFGDRTVSYLPSAHIADRGSTHYVQILNGCQITTVSDLSRLPEALLEVRPTYLLAVPRVWEKLKAALQGGLGETKLADLNQTVLSMVRAKVGLDELRWAMSGAAPIGVETLEFFMELGIDIVEIWGMSECCGAATVNPLGGARPGTVGLVVPGVEVVLAEDGELLIRGPIVMRGYRGEPEKTAEALIGDGWLATGDIGAIDDDGYVSIVDRKKELIINAGGKNMSPANIEGAVKAGSPLIGQIVAIGDMRAYNTALVVLDADAAAAYAAKAGVAASPAGLAADPTVIALVTASITAGNARLSRIEQIKRFSILPTFWEPGTDEMTPTMKLKRKPISTKYAAEIEGLYAEQPGAGVHQAEGTS